MMRSNDPRPTRRDVLGWLAVLPPAIWLPACASRDGGAASTPAPAVPSSDAGLPSSDAGLQNYVRIYIDGDKRIIESNDVPDHATGQFPNSACPFAIGQMPFHFSMTTAPAAAATTTALEGWLFGVAINGVVFDPTGPYWDGDPTNWEFEVMDATARPYLGLDVNNAHVSGLDRNRGGEYHYHGLPTGLLQRLNANGRVVLVGYAADGFPVYAPYGYSVANDPTSAVRELKSGYRLRAGARPDSGPGGHFDGTFVEDFEWVDGHGDLDECNGRFGVTPEYPAGTYYYVLTSDFPYIPRLWRGTPDPSFRHASPPPSALPPGLRGYRGT
jgi:hypothetical protein